jgi:hypothetical protein
MRDPLLEGAIVAFAHNDIYMTAVFVDDRLPQWCEVCGWRLRVLPFLRRQENHRLSGHELSAFALQPHAQRRSNPLAITAPKPT